MEREEIKTLGKEIGQEIGQELGQTLAQTIGVEIAQAMQTLLQSTGSTATGTTVEEGIDDISGDEALEKEMIDETGVRSLNRKMTYDAYLHHHLESIVRSSDRRDTEAAAERTHNAELRQISVQAMQNAVTTSDLVSKNAVQSSNVTNNQTIDHRDLSFDRQWNVDEQSWIIEAMARNPVFKDAIASLVIEILKGNTDETE